MNLLPHLDPHRLHGLHQVDYLLGVENVYLESMTLQYYFVSQKRAGAALVICTREHDMART